MFTKRIVSLSIEGTSIRLVSANRGSVERWDSVPFPSHFIADGYVVDPTGLGRLLKDALAERKLSGGKVVCAHSALDSTSRILRLPRVDARQLPGIVSREARRISNGSVDTNYVHWQALPAANGFYRVCVLVIPKRPLRAFLKALQVAGIKPSFVDLKPLALVRAVNRRTAIIANGETNTVDMAIVVNDLPAVIRSVYIGSEMPTPDYAVDRIGDELLKSLSVYADSQRDRPLPSELPVYLTGAIGGGMAAALNVSTLTGRRVAQLKPPLRCPADLPVADYAVNLGLLLREL